MTTCHVTPPAEDLDAVVRVPGSKSVANRAIVCAMLAQGESTVRGVPDGDDTAVLLNTLRDVKRIQLLAHDSFMIAGDPQGLLPNIVDAQLAGTSSRFLTAVAALSAETHIIDGEAPLRSRPMQDLHDGLIALGAEVTPLGEVGHLPVSVSRGTCVGGRVTVRGDVSSQFISALMLIGPVLRDGITIHVDGPLISRSYVDMTAVVMRAFGARVDIDSAEIVVHATGYTPTDYVIEPDFSSAAFPMVAAVLRQGVVRIPDLALSSLQGDGAIVDILRSLGVEVAQDGNDIVVRHHVGTVLRPISIDMSNCSDLVPAVAVACLAVNGVSTITGVGFIRHKESDRLGDLAAELSMCGAAVRVDVDGLTITGGNALTDATFGTHHDHRLAMALALCSLRSGSCSVQDYEVVSKSWPQFFRDMESILGAIAVGN